MTPVNKPGGAALPRVMALMFSSFVLAFCAQILVHEAGHYLAGVLAGAKGGVVRLHPFYNSSVSFASGMGLGQQVFIGLAGPLLDLAVAIAVGLAFRKSTSVWAFPALSWTAIALFGEGWGIIGSLGAYGGSGGPRFYEDTTQLLRIGWPAEALWAIAAVLVVAGMAAMIRIAHLAGLRADWSFAARLAARLAAYAAYLPAYFLAAIAWILAFSPLRDNLDVRTGQLAIGAGAALILAATHRLVASKLDGPGPAGVDTRLSRRGLASVALAAALSFSVIAASGSLRLLGGRL